MLCVDSKKSDAPQYSNFIVELVIYFVINNKYQGNIYQITILPSIVIMYLMTQPQPNSWTNPSLYSYFKHTPLLREECM